MCADATESSGRSVQGVILPGLLANILLSILKGLAGWFGGSRAVLGDAVHSLSDCVTDLAILVGARFWDRPPDESHPYGHKRIETLLTVAIGVALMGAAAGLLGSVVSSFHDGDPGKRPGVVALIAALISVVGKELLYRWTMKRGRELHSAALQANAWHHRSDAFSSVPVVIAVAGALIYPKWLFLDAIGTLIVAVFIFQAAWRIAWPGLRELSEGAAPDDVQEEIAELAASINGVKEVHKVRTRYVGSRLVVDLHVLVDGAMTVLEGHDIASRVGWTIRERSDVSDAIVHLEPFQTSSLQGVRDEDVRFWL